MMLSWLACLSRILSCILSSTIGLSGPVSGLPLAHKEPASDLSLACQDLTVAHQDLSVACWDPSLAEKSPTETSQWSFKACQRPVSDLAEACQLPVLADRLVFLTVAWVSKLPASCHWPVSGPSGPVRGLLKPAEASNLLPVAWLSSS